jgi:hypothetical protein
MSFGGEELAGWAWRKEERPPAGGPSCFGAEHASAPQCLIAGDGLFYLGLGDGCGWLDLSEGDEAGLLLFA